MTPEGFPYDRAVPGVEGLHPYQPGKPIEELERDIGVINAIKLASNENPWGCSPLVLAALRESVDIGPYPDANGYALKAALSERLGVDTTQITLGNGSNDVLDLLARIFVEPGDEVIYSEYAFLVYALITQAVGGVARVVPARVWGHDLDAMLETVGKKTKLIFLANPNNPTGTYIEADTLEQFVDQVPDHIVIVVDEAYFEYVTVAGYPNTLKWLGRYPNLVVTRTFSKVFGLAGLRVGFGVASKSITDLLNRVRQPFNVSTLAQAAALAALQDTDHVQRCRDDTQVQLQRLIDFCESRGLKYIPSVANFMSVEFGESTPQVYQALLQKGIIVRPLDNYGMPQHLRITVGRDYEMDELFSNLSDLVRDAD